MFEKPSASSKGTIASNVSIGLRELLDSSPDVLFCCDATGRFQWVNAAIEPLLHQRPADLLGRPFTSVLAPHERTRAARRYMRHLWRRQNGPVSAEWMLMGQDGSPVWVAARVKLVMRPDGDILFVGTAHRTEPKLDDKPRVVRSGEGEPLRLDSYDPSAHQLPPGVNGGADFEAERADWQRRLDAATRDGEAKLANANGEWQTRIAETNTEWERRLERTNEDAQRRLDEARADWERENGQARGEWERNSAGARADWERREAELRTDWERREGELRTGFERREGDLRTEWERREAEARDEAGRLGGRLAEVESELRRVRESAEAQAVNSWSLTDRDAMAKQLADAREHLDEARGMAQAKAEFLATMSHEIRTPMNGILGMTQLLLEMELDEEQRSMVEVVHRSARSLLHLINDTLDFSKLEAGKLEMENIDFDLRVTVEEVAMLLGPLASEKHLEFDSRVHHEVPSRVKGDPGRLRQVLLNLGGNAIKFTDRGHVKVRVDRLSETDDHVRLKFVVNDTGIGIGEDQRRLLFQSYQQGDPSIARRYGGTGLGLSISNHLVHLMHGQLGVESQPGMGSTFWFEIEFEKQPAVPAQPVLPTVHLRGVRVLVVDPSRTSRQGQIEMLRAWGCRADEAEGAEDALRLLRDAAERDDAYHLALVEMQLPQTDGEALGATIREDRRLDATLTILTTSVGRRGDAQRALKSGFSAYLLKPIQWGELYDAVVEVMHNGPVSGPGSTLVTRHSLAEARRNRTRVLLVEDNAVNQLVADWALRRLGYNIEVVTTAAAALEATERQRYDVILMDMQLPDMDGTKAVAAIRARERGGPRTPIVALTASPHRSERERCLAAGMDDFLSKPVDLGALCTLVERWTRPAAEPEPTPTRVNVGRMETMTVAPAALSAPEPAFVLASLAPEGELAPTEVAAAVIQPDAVVAIGDAHLGDGFGSAAAESPIVDMSRLEEACMGLPALRDALLQTFMTDVHPRLARLAEAVTAMDPRRIEFEAHGLKGMSATVGAVACAETFGQIERLAGEEQMGGMPGLLERAKDEVQRTEEHIERLETILRRAA